MGIERARAVKKCCQFRRVRRDLHVTHIFVERFVNLTMDRVGFTEVSRVFGTGMECA